MAGVTCVDENDDQSTLRDPSNVGVGRRNRDEIDDAFDSIILAESIHQRKGFEQVSRDCHLTHLTI
jgi:hypothetical protein